MTARAFWAGAPLLALAGCAVWLFAFDGMAPVMRWAAEGQREAQTAMAGALRKLRAGDAGALTAFLSLCFAYGFFHAAGPGHGKVLVGGVGLAGRAGAWRLAVLALVSSLGQGVTAVILVLAGVRVLGLGRQAMTDAAERVFAPASWAAIALVGLWLLLRALRRVLRQSAGQADDHNHDHSGACDCGHSLGPTPQEAANVHSLKEALILIAAIAIRPCTGALFVLIITYSMGIFPAGIAGAMVMALGTGSLTIAVALASTGLRGAVLAMTESTLLPRIATLTEAGAGLLILLVAGALFLKAI